MKVLDLIINMLDYLWFLYFLLGLMLLNLLLYFNKWLFYYISSFTYIIFKSDSIISERMG